MSSSTAKDVKFLPILIIPGFMSSGLEVKQSNIRDSWVGERIWLNLVNLGFESFGRSLPPNTSNTSSQERNTNTKRKAHLTKSVREIQEIDLEEGAPRSGNQAEAERQSAILRNAWLQHMALQDDLSTEREGIQVRPIQGLAGVDYLAPGMFTSHVSYVFGKVIEALRKAGYQKAVNLDAAPYDWRLPPCILEQRDQYFSRTMGQIEGLYIRNNNTPVVLVCHSMGCKIGHYLLNFAKKKQGQEWIDQHIHTYLPIGAPHIGAPKALRSLISGDKMGLDTFLADADALVLGRSLGSAPFLIPTDLPPGATACAFFRMDGAIEVSVVSSIDTNTYLSRREEGSRPDKVKLTLVFGGKAVSTPFAFINGEDGHVQFDETFTFRTGENGPKRGQGLAILVCEPGMRSARKSDTKMRRDLRGCRRCFFSPWKLTIGGQDARWGLPPKDNKVLFWLNIITFWWLIYPIVRYSIELAIKLAFGVIYAFFFCLCCGTVASVDELSKASGGSSPLAVAKVKHVREEIFNFDEVEERIQRAHEVVLDLDLVAYGDNYQCCACCCTKRKYTISIKIKWIPPKSTARPRSNYRQSICQPDPGTRPLRGYLKSKERNKRYTVRAGHDTIEAECLSRVFDHMDKDYDKDPIDPRGSSSMDPPPVRAIKAIYGINLPTEVGTVFKRRRAILGNSDIPDNKLKPDDTVFLNGNDGDHIIKNGVLYEVGSETEIAGDGTVPYWSLSYVKKWEKNCDVTVHELEGAEHREILGDKRLHDILIDYCCLKDCAAEEGVKQKKFPLDQVARQMNKKAASS